MRLQKRIISYEDVSINANELITISEAADMLSITMPGLISAIERGTYTEIVDADAANRRYNRRYLLRSEVQAALTARGVYVPPLAWPP